MAPKTKAITPKEWRNGTKFYLTFVRYTIFGEPVLIQQWGSLARGITGEKHTHLESFEQGCKLMEGISKRRVAHGYLECRT